MTLNEIKNFFKDDHFAVDAAQIEIESASNNEAVCTMDVKPFHMNAANVIMGGAIYTLADFTFAVATNQNEDITTVTSSSQINYLNPAKCNKLIAKSKCIKDGKRNCYYTINVYDENDKLIAVNNVNGTHLPK